MGMQPAPSAQRAIEIVSLLRDHPGETLPVAEIARRLGHNRATCQAVLLALQEAGWVRRGGGRGYAIGAGLIPFSAAALASVPIIDVLRPAVDEIHRAVSLEVLGCVVAGHDIVIVARAGPSDPFSTSMRVGQSMPLAPPVGLAFVAWDEAEIDRWAARTPNPTKKLRERMRKAAALVRELGYCVTLDPATRQALGETVAGLARGPLTTRDLARQTELISALAHDEYVTVHAEQHRLMRVSQISAPVFGPGKDVIAVMGIQVSPGQVHLGDDVPTLAQHLRETTSHLTHELGGTPPE